MSAEVIDNWLPSGQYARIDQLLVKPVEHKLLKGKPLSSQKGQAEAFYLMDNKSQWWILKKFHNACSLDRNYLEKIASLLPKADGFLCGTQRQILHSHSLKSGQNDYYSPEFSRWLDGTILMPRIKGIDWSTLADELRCGNIHLDKMQRLTLCRNLTQLIELLEKNQCCHRDLSSGNVFIDTDTWQVSLIDFDSFYHPSLAMPQATTCGTLGYTAPYSWNNGKLDPAGTWCAHADRYALTLLIAEFLLVDQNSNATGEGGIFDQDELKRCSGNDLNSIVRQIKIQYPKVGQLLEETICSSNFSQCPSPQDWNNFYDSIVGLSVTPPSLSELENIPTDYFAKLLVKRRPAAPLWPAPSLREIPQPSISLPKPQSPHISPTAVALPKDPWSNKKALTI